MEFIFARRADYRTGVPRQHAFARVAAGAVLTALIVSVARAGEPTRPIGFATFERLFAADSPWNSRPVDPVLRSEVVPKSDYFPAVDEGTWSTGVFEAKATDLAVTVKALPGKSGVWNPDAEEFRDITIAHWPASLTPAIGADGHADLVDVALGVVHSFWQLRHTNGQWVAAQYAWSPLNGRGWGDPAHYFQGARAAGVPTSAGVIRKFEVRDGDSQYRHALAMSLTFNALSPQPVYVYPATSADSDAATTNHGTIPEGSLMMLPPSFDPQKITTPALRKIAETLKSYGAYVVDRNFGTPFVIYAEIGSNIDLHHGGWNNTAASELDEIRGGLRRVVSTNGWIDGNGAFYKQSTNHNLLSMRGPWRAQSGDRKAAFDDWTQSVVFSNGGSTTVAVNDSGRGLSAVAWALPEAGKAYRLVAHATGHALLRLVFRLKGSDHVVVDTGDLPDGSSKVFTWPANASPVVFATSGEGDRSAVRGELTVVASNAIVISK